MHAAVPLSILMPVHNGARFLNTAIDSILTQTYRDFEFLIIDDGSTDATPRILASYAAGDARIRVITVPHAGIVAALNHGLSLAAGRWVARMDADDIAWPQRLARQLTFAASVADAAAIGSFWRVIDASGAPRRMMSCPTGAAAIAAALPQYNCLAHPTMLLRREAVLACGGYRPAFAQAEDYDLWLRLSEHFEIHVVPDVLLDYRDHAGQANWTKLEQRILSVLAAQFAAARRGAGQVDPFAHATVIDRNVLQAAGVAPAEIEAALISGSLNAAKDALAADHGAAVSAALQLLFEQPGLRWKTRLHGWLLGIRGLLAGS
jgi:glycosyltransferase involved in cell wall biosynthesis